MKAKYLLLGGLAVVAAVSTVSKKGMDVSEVVSQLQSKIKSIRNLRLTSKGISMNVDITLTNPTSKDLSVATAGAVKLVQLDVMDKKGNLIASATPNITALAIAPGNSIVLENIPVESTYSNIVNVILGGPSTNPKDYEVVTHIEALGQRFTV